MATEILLNNKPGEIGPVPLIEFESGKDGKPVLDESKRPKIAREVTLRILPGINKIDAADLALLKEHPVAKELFVSGLLVHDVKHKGAESSLASFQEHEAVELVTHTVDLEILDKWADGEKRREVKKALKQRISEIRIKTRAVKPE